MANTWDDLPIEMMGERPDRLYFMKERRNEDKIKHSDPTPHSEE